MAKRIVLPGGSEIFRIIEKAGDLQIWKRSNIYEIAWLTNRKNKIEDTMTLLENANIPDYIFKVIGEIAAELISGVGRDPQLDYKENIIKSMKKERDSINWILSLGISSSSSSSSSYSSSSNSSSSSSSSSSSTSFSSSSFSSSSSSFSLAS